MAKTNRLKVLFVYDYEYPHLWKDGLWAAFQLLGKEFDIEYYNIKEYNGEHKGFGLYDFVLGWGGFQSKVDILLRTKCSRKKGLCIGGNVFPYQSGYDVLFHETDWVKDYLKLEGNCVKAFGVNTQIYFPSKSKKIFDVISVGAFANWKRHYLLRGKNGLRLAIGQIQKNNLEESMSIINVLLYEGVMVSDMVSPEKLSELYNFSKLCYIPAHLSGGGERAILEARACGIDVECENDNPKLRELLTGEIPTEVDYSEALKKGILSCL